MLILTDLSEVLIRGVYGVDELIGQSYGPEVAEKFLERAQSLNPVFIELLRGHLTENEYWEIFFEDHQFPFDALVAKDFLSKNFSYSIPGTIELYKSIIEYPESLDRDAEIISGTPEFWIVSDHIREREQELKIIHPDVFELATKEIWSYDYGIIKQDKGFFERLLRENQLNPNEVIFIDDLYTNIWHATDTLEECIEFKGAQRLEKTLRRLGFKFKTNEVLRQMTPRWAQ